ncbi:hypothetical protein C0Z18_30895 [Trinickia dabaoshanensis]|uniref:Pilus assembly protein PilO n=1 Tax=Trinickia dabaoshanensis TaxID=564714 RepID=A0A2N7VC13_9BURK|nr:type 4b pilus protein PilO2 [Trinickia dabaoshanensis]PMS14657.1 hypothetical protein C0Z18_30895 [Trinickia dabaoshanensis]
MSAAIPVPIAGFGEAVAGLDWLELPGLDGKNTEVKQLGRGVNAAWQFVWSVKGKDGEYVAFVSKGEVKKRPVAAAVLVRAAVSEDTYLTLVDIGDGRLWAFAVSDGMPVNRMDRVADATDLMGQVRDFLTSLPDPSKAPIYTDKPELFETLPYGLDIRPFSLEILRHSIRKRDFSKATFSRHSSIPVAGIIATALLASLTAGYVYYQDQAEGEARRHESQARRREIAKRKAALMNQVRAAINAAAPARVAVPAYMDTLRDVPASVSGWRLAAVECEASSCTLTYKAAAFATWNGYLKAKPAGWPAPSFDGDIQRVDQSVPVHLPSLSPRAASALAPRENVRLKLGNLAQISRPLGLTVTLQSGWEPVAPKTAGVDDQWVPLKTGFGATGAAVLLRDLAMRLPDDAGVRSVSFKLDDKITFDLKGEAYANP